jgi:glycosyltransferase involved in cell wall biosynthesis
MRAGLQLRGLAGRFEVVVVVVPVVAGPDDLAWPRRFAVEVAVAPLPPARVVRAGLVELLGSAAWRERLAAAEPLPELAKRATPALAASVVDAAGGPGAVPVHAVRSYLAPLAVAVAERLGSPWATLDLDDDDEALERARGHADEADANHRLVATFASAFAWVSLASPLEARAVAERHGLATVVVPNGVDVPALADRPLRPPDGAVALLFVGNLTYEPNAEAAVALAREVLPAARRVLRRRVTVTLVGRFVPGSAVEELGSLDGVRLVGFADDLGPHYASADVVVAPLAHGSGTRIKVLEAFAHRVPVVTSTVGAAGLEVEDGRELLIADDPRRAAEAIGRLAGDPALAGRLVDDAAALVERSFASDVVCRRVGDLVAALDAAALDDG